MKVIGGGLSGLEFVGTILSKNSRLPTGVAVPFINQKAVGEYFGTGSNEYKLAGNYFLADSNASKKPNTLYFIKLPYNFFRLKTSVNKLVSMIEPKTIKNFVFLIA